MQAYLQPVQELAEREEKPMKKFWNWKNRTVTNQETQEQKAQERTLFLNGTIAEESWFDDGYSHHSFSKRNC